MQNTVTLLKVLPVLVVCGVLAACGSKTASTAKAYKAPNVVKNDSFKICSGFGCTYKDKFSFSASNGRKIKKIMSAGNKSAKAERQALAKVIGVMENMTRARLGFQRDVEKAYQKNLGVRGQMDCVDESLNTTAYLNYLSANGLLKFHKPRRYYAERGFLLDGRYPHKSAVMIENNGKKWSVDSWHGPGGEKAQVMELSKWRKVRNSRNSS